MTTATPPTPNLTAESRDKNSTNNEEKANVFDNGSSTTANNNGNGNGNSNNGKKKKKKKAAAAAMKKKSQHAHDEVSADSTNNNNNDNHHGHKRAHDEDIFAKTKKKKSASAAKNKSKKIQRAANKQHNNEVSTTVSDIANNCGDNHHGHKRVHDEEFLSAHKKQRSKKSTKTASSRSRTHDTLLYLLFYALGTLITLPFLFSTCAHLSCGGGRLLNVNSMVDLVVLKKKSSDESSSLVDLMGVLKESSMMADGNAIVREDEQENKKGKRKKGNKRSDSISATSHDEKLMESTTLHESMCQVSSIAIGNFVYYLPYAQWLVLRNPFAATTMMGYYGESEQQKKKEEEDNQRRRGMFQRVAARHKKKHHEQQHTSSSSASEEIDRKHPIRHILEGASIFFHHRKQKKMERKHQKQQHQGEHKNAGGESERVVDWKKWKYAMSDDYEMTSEEIRLVKVLAQRVIAKADNISTECKDSNEDCNNKSEKQIASLSEGSNMPYRPIQDRLDAVSWGGVVNADSTRWWQRKNGRDTKKISSQSEGARVLAAYLKIMRWPKDMHAKYPFRLCAKGCDSEVSLLHTLEWREKYRPWCVSDASVQFNKAGFIYMRGHSRPGPKQLLEAEKSNDASIISNGGHSMVYYRPGLASPSENSELYGRNMINALEMAVSDSLVRNKGTIGRFNVVMDCSGMSSKNSPSIANVKKLFSVLQDHFPDRLGVILAANLSGLTQMLMKMVLPFVTEDVRAKIHIIPNGEEERREMLLQFMEEEEIPYYLGGKDEYRFDVKGYYEGKCILPEEGIVEYHSTMPYHA
eukprot:CAMPEP_0172320230 /NCGR_PEP_ID=MMETSP1058-20130122/40040_1 /TAXON_ID=83371 /ORGANISM="Detonula confervacea, Strain CCMP 353" /LENGTH=806 /DNA_ID=CAMNT_0013035453 /DNA_START=51 /DNA_END=2471 /DNA_ORIENTATION=+